ncbi:hypothetical protein [Megamonas funiformis]|jgi:hypothetical protein|uniref:hypothetical protein n=1 Tax=Megamonas funiformis TaxID=437897 RepID=UPI000E486938|nr:hypothetical protein [Megamonas funiformis]RGW46195.1 hypothetical protein DWV74_07635 [Megamonas funiformis]
MELKPLSLIISFRSNYAKKLNNDTQVLYWVLWDKWNYLRRPKEFNIDNNTLMIEAKLKNYSQLNDSRKKLIEAGLIKYVPSKTRGKSSTYALIKNYVENATPNLNQNLNQNPKPNPNTNLKQNLNEPQELNNNANSYDLITENTNLKSNLTQNLNTNSIPNLKQNPNKSNRDIENNIYFLYTHAREAIDFYKNNVAVDLSPNALMVLSDCVEVHGKDDTLRAMQETQINMSHLKDVAFMKYARGILRSWAKYGKKPPLKLKQENKPKVNKAVDSLMALMEG